MFEINLKHYTHKKIIPAGCMLINLFVANVSFLFPLKTPENQRFSCVLIGTLARNGLKAC